MEKSPRVNVNEQNNNCERSSIPPYQQLIRQHHNGNHTVLPNVNKDPKGHKQTKSVNNNKLRPSYSPKWSVQLPLLTAPNSEGYSKAKPPTTHVSVPNDINNYTVVDGYSETSNKEFSRVNQMERKYKSSSSNRDTKSGHAHRTQKVSNTYPQKVPKSFRIPVYHENHPLNSVIACDVGGLPFIDTPNLPFSQPRDENQLTNQQIPTRITTRFPQGTRAMSRRYNTWGFRKRRVDPYIE